MPYQNSNKHKQAKHTWYAKNKQLTAERTKKARQKQQKWFKELKSQYSCSNCPEDDPRCIDFHHKDPNDKLESVGVLACRGRPKAVILAEIEKCIPLCANCHRKQHIKKY